MKGDEDRLLKPCYNRAMTGGGRGQDLLVEHGDGDGLQSADLTKWKEGRHVIELHLTVPETMGGLTRYTS